DDGGRLLADGQGAVGLGHRVVGVAAQGDRDRVAAHVGELGGGGGQRVVQAVAVDRAGDGGGQRRVGVAVGLVLVVGDDGGRLLADGQGAVGLGHRVVGVAAQGDRDRVAAHVGELGGGGGQRVVQAVAVDRAGDGGGQRRVGVAVGLVLVVGDDGGRLLADGQGAVGLGHRVVGVAAQGDRDRVAAHVG